MSDVEKRSRALAVLLRAGQRSNVRPAWAMRAALLIVDIDMRELRSVLVAAGRPV